MKYIIWGAGIRGKRLFGHLKDENVIAFLDLDKSKQGSICCGKQVIDLETYKNDYMSFPIIITFSHEIEGINILQKNGLSQYFLLSECPGELQAPVMQTDLVDYVIGTIDFHKKIGIKGYTLYAVFLYEKIQEKCDFQPFLVVDEKISNDLKTILMNNKIEMCFENEIDELGLEYIYDCNFISDIDSVLTNCRTCDYKYIYDCSDRIEAYHNSEIEKFKNIHKGERCFIVATGPSLRMDDLDCLWKYNEFCFSMNKIWYAFEKTRWRPTYYIADDWRMLKYYSDELEKINAQYLFLGDTDREYWNKPHKKNILKHHFNCECSEFRLPKFSQDFSRQCYMGSTVTYSCMQLAVYMGFSQIYLLGVDFSYGDNNKDMKYSHFFKEKELVSIGYTKQVTLAYEKAKEYTEQQGIVIYNATRGGKLEIFERVDFDDLFEKKKVVSKKDRGKVYT